MVYKREGDEIVEYKTTPDGGLEKSPRQLAKEKANQKPSNNKNSNNGNNKKNNSEEPAL